MTAIKSMGGSESGFLIYVSFLVNGRNLSASVDTRAVHTFVLEGLSKMLRLKVAGYPSRIKTMKAKAKAATSVI